MAITWTKEARAEAIASLQKYFQEEMEAPIGNLAANSLLDYFFEEFAPIAYNQGIADAQARLQTVVNDLDVEIHQPPLQYWPNQRRKTKR